MALTKFTLTLNETGKKVSKTLEGVKINFLNSYWSYDEEGKQKIKKAKLTETVYFFTEVEGLYEDFDLELKLYDSDAPFLINTFDDDEFPDEEIVIKTKVIKGNKLNYIRVKLHLDSNWEQVIRDDAGGYTIELYWTVFYKHPNRLFEVKESEKINNILRVTYSDQNLYIRPALGGYDFPEIIANDGAPIVLMDLSKSLYNTLEGDIKSLGQKGIDKTIHKIGLAKLEKGMLVTQNNGVIIANKQIYGKNYIAVDKANMKLYGNLNTNGERIFLEGTKNRYGTYLSVKDGEILQHRDIVSNGKTIKNVAQPKKIAGSSSIDQYAYFTNTGKRVTLLRTVRFAGTVMDFFSIGQFMADNKAMSKPLPIPFISPVTDVIMKDYMKNEKEFYDTWINDDMLKAKSEGVDAVKEYIDSQEHNWEKGFNWRHMEVPNETVNQLLSGKFRIFDELNEKRVFDGNTIIYKIIKDDKKGRQYEVHSIFINE